PTRAALASGAIRMQLGLKLRAQDSCNLLYVMWRLEPACEVVVQIKHNPGLSTHEQCGARGYATITPTRHVIPPVPARDSDHALAARISGDDLLVWLDHTVVWCGTLPPHARELRGPAGFRTDNVEVDLALHA